MTLDFSFLDGTNYEATIWQDGANVNRFGGDYRKLTQTVKKGDKLKINLGIGGGWVARLIKK
jgi:alpha-glucosidase